MPLTDRFHLSSNSNFVSHLLGVPGAIDIYHRWGPSARNCILFAGKASLERRHERNVREAANSFAENLPMQPPPGEALASVAGSHKLFCVRPEPGGEHDLAYSAVISPHVQLILQNAVSGQLAQNRKRFYAIMSAHPHCRSTMGWLLEQQFHRWIGLDALSQARGSANSLECKTKGRFRSISLKPTREEPLNSVEELVNARRSLLPIYYRPTSERFAGVDGLILTPDEVILIQVTVSSAHALKKEHLDPLYQNLPVNIRSKPWKFVWVVPEDEIGEALIKRRFDVKGEWPDIRFYWCRFPFDTKVSFWIRLRCRC